LQTEPSLDIKTFLSLNVSGKLLSSKGQLLQKLKAINQ